MQSDYALCREIMRACHDSHPNAVYFADLCRKLTGRTDESIRYHVQVLEDEGFVETGRLQSTASGATHAVVQYVRLSHPLAADRFLNPQLDGPAD